MELTRIFYKYICKKNHNLRDFMNRWIMNKLEKPFFSWQTDQLAGRYHAYVALGLILLAACLRLWQLNSIPPGLWFDEGLNAMEAVWMLKTNTWPVFILQGQGREAMFYYPLALSIYILGETIYAVRLVQSYWEF